MLVDASFSCAWAYLMFQGRGDVAWVSRQSPLKSNKACEKRGRDL